MVDCGLFQGLAALRQRNWNAPAGRPSVHRRRSAHPRAPRSRRVSAAARRRGFNGRIFCTPGRGPVLARARLMPAGCRRKMRARPTRSATRSHTPALPLFTEADAVAALQRLQPVGYHRPMPVAPRCRDRVHARRTPARVGLRAHAPFRRPSGTVLFGGDLGRYDRPVLPDPVAGIGGRHPAASNRPTATGCTRSTATAKRSPRPSATPSPAAARSSFRRLRSVG